MALEGLVALAACLERLLARLLEERRLKREAVVVARGAAADVVAREAVVRVVVAQASATNNAAPCSRA